MDVDKDQDKLEFLTGRSTNSFSQPDDQMRGEKKLVREVLLHPIDRYWIVSPPTRSM